MTITDQQKRAWIYSLSNLPVRHWPFEHAILQNTIPADLYAAMLEHMPPHEEFVLLSSTGRIGKGAYPQRYINGKQSAFWEAISQFLLTPAFGIALARPFGKLAVMLKTNPAKWAMDTLLIEDLPGYRIGPHADASHKVLSALFYLGTERVWTDEWGTSIYTPKPESMIDPTAPDPRSGRHYEFEQFDRITTVPYQANHGLMFVKVDKSWHGVETIPAIPGERRIVLLADVKLKG